MRTHAALLFLALAGGPAAQEGIERPNLLLIFTDDQSWRTVSCYAPEGARPWVRTPHIDRLAKEGVRFSYAYGAAWCTPARASLLTGLLPHGIEGFSLPKGFRPAHIDPETCRFWPRALRKVGYRTAMIGKWHLGKDVGLGVDWDHAVVWDQYAPRGDWYNDQYYVIDGAPKKRITGYSTDLLTGFAGRFIRREHDRPWFLKLSYNAPHLPNTVPPRHADLYGDAEVAVPADILGPRPDKPAYMKTRTRWTRGKGKVANAYVYDGWPYRKQGLRLPKLVRDYNRLIRAVDDGVGGVLKALEQSGQLDRTLIVFTSDQGFAWGEHGFTDKTAPYEACMRMPFIVRGPGVGAGGGVCARPVTLRDIGPTFLAAAGAKLPWPMHGSDLAPLLRNPKMEWNRPVLVEHFFKSFGSETARGVTGPDDHDGIPWWISMRKGKLKYIRTLVEGEVEELYDLEQDPRELRNLAVEGSSRAVLIRCREEMMAELTRTRAALVGRLPSPH